MDIRSRRFAQACTTKHEPRPR